MGQMVVLVLQHQSQALLLEMLVVVALLLMLLLELLVREQMVAVMVFNNQQLPHKTELQIQAVVEVAVAHLMLIQLAVMADQVLLFFLFQLLITQEQPQEAQQYLHQEAIQF